MTHTNTFAVLKVSQAAYDEIRQKLLNAGYSDQFHPDHSTPGKPIIDMYGIALSPICDPGETPCKQEQSCQIRS